VESQEYDDLLRTLVRTMAHQESINDDLREFARQQLAMNERLTGTLERIEVTLDRIDGRLTSMDGRLTSIDTRLGGLETLLKRLLRHETNGEEA